MKDALIYFISFVVTMCIVIRKERKSKVQIYKDEHGFENAMITVATALVIFIAFVLLVRSAFGNHIH